MAIDNLVCLIGRVISSINKKKIGNFEFKYFDLEVDSGSKEDKNNVIQIKVTDRMLNKLNWDENTNIYGSMVGVNGILIGSYSNGSNFINISASDIVVFTKSLNNGTSSQSKPKTDDYGITDDDLPF